MAENGQLPRFLGTSHERFKTPYVAIAISSLVMLVLTLEGSFISALTISTVIRLVIYATTCAALPVLRRRGPALAGAFRAPGGTFTALAAIALCVWLITSSTLRDIGITAGAAALGLVLYYAARGGARRERYSTAFPSDVGGDRGWNGGLYAATRRRSS